MAQFEIHITEKGREMLAASVGGQAVQFTRMVLGDGGYSGDLSLVEELISQKLELEIGRVEHRGSDASIQGTITADTEFAPFYWREIGLYAKMPGGPEMLAVYGNAGEKADYLDGTSGALDEKIIRITIRTEPDQVVADVSGVLYATREELQQHRDDPAAHLKPLTHQKSGTAHALEGLAGINGIVAGIFTATAGFAAGDTITVDGTAYAIQLSNGEAAEDNLFVSGASVPVVIDTAGKKVNFKAAGASRKFASGSISGIYGGGTSTITLGWEPKYIFCICNQTGRMEPENLTASALAYIDGLVTGFAESDNTPDGAAYIRTALNVIQTTKTGFTVNNIPVRLWGNENSYFFPYSRETFYWAFD